MFQQYHPQPLKKCFKINILMYILNSNLVEIFSFSKIDNSKEKCQETFFVRKVQNDQCRCKITEKNNFEKVVGIMITCILVTNEILCILKIKNNNDQKQCYKHSYYAILWSTKELEIISLTTFSKKFFSSVLCDEPFQRCHPFLFGHPVQLVR